MKGLKLFLAMCFAVPFMDGAVADATKNMQRISSARNQQTTTTTTRGTNPVKARTQKNISRTPTNKNIIQRNAVSDTTTKGRSATLSRENSVVARSAKKQSTATRPTTQNTSNLRTHRSGLSRSATIPTRESVMNRDFSKCKTVFFDCMDEFCANKDAQLKRCACSARSNEFKNTQKSLDNIENKLLDFSQRLLKVNMDPADAAVINQETAGEKAYNETKDKTASKKALDDIAKKLNTNFDSAGNNMSALSWSLNADSAFDAVDSLGGTSTTAKSGVALKNAAMPICREMAAEVCSDEDISLVENSYNMTIEQDCNTVKKAFDTQTQAARNKVLESSALLDMTRLNNYQDNNSDDILTCKSKMLDMLTNTNVCGDNLTKCLDISGRYINPTTGEAFLSPDLINLSTLIVRPTNTDSWAKTPKNASFVSYLNNKKKYIESATQNCQTIADDVWNDFIEDALAKIKIAQNEKLEEVRQSCTTLLSECLDDAKESLSEFDSRALSTFGVMTDKTVNALCENIKTSCSVVMQYTPDNTLTDYIDNTDWETGVTDIAANETYNKIISTCREIGRDCIINSCKSITGNFGLCESIHGSVNRHSILTRAACWNQVFDCVAQANDKSIENIYNILPNYGSNPQALYDKMYGQTLQSMADTTVYDICHDGLGYCNSTDSDSEITTCHRCRIAEQIWGNCKSKPDNRTENQILIPDDPNTTTLLSWFAKNTHTQEDQDSCAVSICPAGSIDYTIGTSVMCAAPDSIMQCTNENILCQTKITTPGLYLDDENNSMNITNCCPTQVDGWGNCCMNNGVTTEINDHLGILSNNDDINTTSNICTSNQNITSMTLLAKYQISTTNTYIFCTGNITGGNQQINCDGEYVIIQCDNGICYYSKPRSASDYDYNINYFINSDADKDNESNYCSSITNNNTCKMTGTCQYGVGCNTTGWSGSDCNTNGISNNWLIKFSEN